MTVMPPPDIAYPKTARSRAKRIADRAAYDRATVHGILDASLLAHIGYVIDGQPYVTPTTFWRHGETLYWHGSSASRMLRHQADGHPVCFTVAHLDGLVLARSGFHHSANYRSVMAFGRAHKIEDPQEKQIALDAFIDRLYPGRRSKLRANAAQELKGTSVIGMVIEEAVAKIRKGPPVDDEDDYALTVWAGVIPIHTVLGRAVPDPRQHPHADPHILGPWREESAALDEVLLKTQP